ncbi:hypothetical protein EV360DRAFT_88866 [Lentinula raphanica]|nr:hypothetical protein EV360DRAFT_88866 [Lentinula raphanica]
MAIGQDKNTASVTNTSFSALNRRYLSTSTSIPGGPDRVEPSTHAYSLNGSTPHVYRTSTKISLDMPHSRYRPRQRIPSDVATSLACDREAEMRLRPTYEHDLPRRSSEAQRDQANNSRLDAVHAIDPACLRPIVTFDYACLEDLDEELILRPRSAFTELCWSSAVHNSYSSTDHSSCSTRKSHSAAAQNAQISGARHFSPSSPLHVYSSHNPPLDVAEVSQELLTSDSDSEFECHSQRGLELHLPSWHSFDEDPAVLILKGSKSLDPAGVKLCEGKHGIGGVTPASINQVTSPYIHDYDHDSSINSQVQFFHDNHSRLPVSDTHDGKAFSIDGKSCVSFQRDRDEDPFPLEKSTPLPSLITCQFLNTDAFLCSNIHTYAGVANPQESIGLYPIPVAADFRTTGNWKGRCMKLVSKSESFASSVSGFCRTIFPLSRRAVKG